MPEASCEAMCTFCDSSTSIVMANEAGDVRICSECLELARELCAAQQSGWVTNEPPPVLTDEQRRLVEDKMQSAVRLGEEIRNARRRGDHVPDPMEWYRCGFCGAHRRERSFMVSAPGKRPGICDLCAKRPDRKPVVTLVE